MDLGDRGSIRCGTRAPMIGGANQRSPTIRRLADGQAKRWCSAEECCERLLGSRFEADGGRMCDPSNRVWIHVEHWGQRPSMISVEESEIPQVIVGVVHEE